MSLELVDNIIASETALFLLRDDQKQALSRMESLFYETVQGFDLSLLDALSVYSETLDKIDGAREAYNLKYGLEMFYLKMLGTSRKL